MPCFARNIRRLGIKMPEKVSLFEDGEYIERKLKERLNVDSHEELHAKMDQMDDEELKEILEQILAEIQREKEKASTPEEKEKIKEKYVRIVV